MKPDFFIIGAPKSGTTTLASYLKGHPNVCMSKVKEPHFFNTDHGHAIVSAWSEYLSLYDCESTNTLATGEASVWYMYSKVAVSNIENTIKEPRYIVMLRNPYTLAPSLHAQHLYSGYEDILDFNKAWVAQSDQYLRKKVPKECPCETLLRYADICCLGSQLKNLYSQIPKTRTKVIFQEDFSNAPQNTWSDVQGFLGLPHDNRTNFPRENPGKRIRFHTLRKLQLRTYRMRKSLGLHEFHLGIGAMIRKLNVAEQVGPKISTETANQMRHAFEPDIELLMEITGRDLSAWIQHGRSLVRHAVGPLT